MVGFGPVAGLARLLRNVHEAAGSPPLDSMKLGPSSSPSTLHRAKSGQYLPTRDCVAAILQRCGVPAGDTYDGVLRTWEETAAAAEAFRPALGGCQTEADLVEALVALAEGQRLATGGRLHTAELARRLAEVAGTVLGETKNDRKKWTVAAIPESEIVAEFVDRSRPPTERVLDHLVFACGGIDRDVRHWRRHLDRVRELRRNREVLASVASTRPADPLHPTGTPSPPAARTPGVVPSPRRSDPSWPTDPEPVPPIPVPVPPAAARSAPAAPLSPWSPASSPQLWTRRRVLTTAVVGAVGMAAVGATAVLVVTGDRRTPPALLAGPSTPPVHSGTPLPPDGSRSARDWLGHLAALVRQGEDVPAIGRYAYTRVRFWSRETTPAGRDGAVRIEEERLWWAEDLSGLRVSVRPDQGDEVAEPHPYPAGGLPIVVRFPSTDPTILAQQLDREQPPQVGPAGRLRAVADVNLFHPLDRHQRAAVLTVLADTDGLSYRGVARDRAGRAGIAVSADVDASGPHGERVTLTFNTTTGELLSQETSRLPGADGPDPADGATSSYVLYLERSRTDHLG